MATGTFSTTNPLGGSGAIAAIPLPASQLLGTGGLSLARSQVNVQVSAGSLSLDGTGSVGTATIPSQVNVTGHLASGGLAGSGGLANLPSQLNMTAGTVIDGEGGIIAYPLHPETLFINGTDIWDCGGYFTPDLSGLGTVPAKKTGDVAVPGRQGSVRTLRKTFGPQTMALTLQVRGTAPDGSLPRGAAAERNFYANLDSLLANLNGVVTLTHILPDRSTRAITAEVLEAMTFTRQAWAKAGTVQVTLNAAAPFWREPSPVTSHLSSGSGPSALPEFEGSTAPIEDAIIVVTGPCTNPSLACGDSQVTYHDTLASGQSLTIDAGNWTVSSASLVIDYAKLTHAGTGPWLVLSPGQPVTFSHTGTGTATATITAQRAFLAG